MSLYEVTINIQELFEGMQKAIEEGDEDVQQLYADTLESMKFEFEHDAEGYVKYIRNCEADAKMLKEEADHFADRAKAASNRATNAKKFLEYCLKACGIEKMNAGAFKLSIQKNGGKVPVTVNVDASELPDEYRTVSYKADTDAIRSALDKGYEGNLFQYGEVGRSIRIR